MNHSTSQFTLSTRGSFQVTAEILFTYSLMVLGVCGNAFVFLAVWREKTLRTTPNVFVVNLAVTDFLFSTTVLPLTTATLIEGAWKLGAHACKLQAFMFSAVLNATLVTMTAISINRFIMIRYRNKYKSIYQRKNVCFMVAGIWCYAILIACQPLFGSGRYFFNQYNGFCAIDKKTKSAGKTSRAMAFLSLYANIIIIIRCYFGVYRTVSQHRRQINSRQNGIPSIGDHNRELRGDDVHIAKTLFIVICLFGVCWFPTAIAGIVFACGVSIPGLAQELLTFTVCLASVVNPIVYAIRNKRFRRTFKKIIDVQFSWHNTINRNRVKQLETTM